MVQARRGRPAVTGTGQRSAGRWPAACLHRSWSVMTCCTPRSAWPRIAAAISGTVPVRGLSKMLGFATRSGEPDADDRRAAQRRRVSPDLAARGVDLGERLGHDFRSAQVADVPEVAEVGPLRYSRAS